MGRAVVLGTGDLPGKVGVVEGGVVEVVLGLLGRPLEDLLGRPLKLVPVELVVGLEDLLGRPAELLVLGIGAVPGKVRTGGWQWVVQR